MSEQPPKTRRRFLADLLFLGGSVTAASILAKSTLFESGDDPAPDHTPSVAVEKPTPQQTVVPKGNVVEPKPECEVTPDPVEPEIAGRMVMPREPNPAGGARPIEYKPGSAVDGDMELPPAVKQ